MYLIPAKAPYVSGVYCQIRLPLFNFEGIAFEFGAQLSGPAPRTAW
jgi:hypothetical protein